MAANILPNRVFGFGTNKIFDAGFDSQFQWIGDMHNVTLRGNYIFERQILNSTFRREIRPTLSIISAILKFQQNTSTHTYAINVARFQLTGTPDAFVYSNFQNLVPNTQGWIVDVSYLPFSHGSPGPSPFFNMRVGLAYTYFSQLNGSNNYSSDLGYSNCQRQHSLLPILILSSKYGFNQLRLQRPAAKPGVFICQSIASLAKNQSLRAFFTHCLKIDWRTFCPLRRCILNCNNSKLIKIIRRIICLISTMLPN